MTRKVYTLALLLAVLIWSAAFVVVKIGLQEIKLFNLAFYRFVIASPLIILVVQLRNRLQIIKIEDIPFTLILALTGVTLFYTVQFTALSYTTATNVSILANTSVIFIALMSLFLGEKFTKFKAFGICLAFIGVILVVSKGKLEFFTSKTFIGDILVILGGFLWAVYTVLGKGMLKKYNPESLTAYAFAIGSVLLFPLAIYEGLENPFYFSITAWVSILYLSIVASVIAYLLWYSALTVMDATKVGVFIYLMPLFTAIIAYLVLRETIGILTILGGILTILGVYFVEKY